MSVRKFLRPIVLSMLLIATMPVAHAAHDPIAAIGSSPATSQEDELVWFARRVDAVPELTKMVETQFAGGKILDVSFDGQGAVPVFNMKASRQGQIWNIAVDASKRTIIRVDALMLRSDLGAEDQRKVTDFEQSNIALSETIEIAEQYGVGKAIGAGLEYVEGRLVFLVMVVSDGALKEVSVDPSRDLKKRRRSSARSAGDLLQ